MTAVAIVLVVSLGFSSVHAQSAFNTTSFDMLNWEEGPAVDPQLMRLNEAITNALGSTRTDFCFQLETEPADILEYMGGPNCIFDGGSARNGFRPGNLADPFDLVAGAVEFDYDSRVQHSLKITGYDVSQGSPIKSNSLSVSFELLDVDEPPYWISGATPRELRHLRVNERFYFDINDYAMDPEGRPISFDFSSPYTQICSFTGVNQTGAFICRRLVEDSVISDQNVTVQHRSSRLYVTADGSNLTAAGIYEASLRFVGRAGMNTTGPTWGEFTIRIKNGENNVPNFKGGATGFTASVDESTVPGYYETPVRPATFGAWTAEDLDNDRISYSIVGPQTQCRDPSPGSVVQVGQMCIWLTYAVMGSNQDTYFSLAYPDYEDIVLSPSKSFTITLRASDGWDQTDIPITVTINDKNELYVHSDQETERVLPSSVSVVEGESITFDLSQFFTDPENDTLTYSAYAHVHTGLVEVTGETLTINGTGTNANNPILSDTITVEVTDGQLTRMRDISVRVRNTNEPPRWEPSGVLRVAGSIDENVPTGSLVTGLVRYSDPDSPAEELDVILDSSAFEGIVDPLMEDGALCEVASASCVAQTGQIALITTSELNHESTSRHDVRLGLHDGWIRSSEAQDVTIEITVNDLNDEPISVGRVPNRSVSVQGTQTFDASVYFADEDESDRLLVTATSRDSTIASVTVAGAADVTVTGEGVGTARIELTATDLAGSTATQLFDVVVAANQSPVAQSQVFRDVLPENLELLVGDIVDIPLSGLFVDPDGDDIELSVESVDDSVLLVSVASDGSTATLVARTLGTSDLIFTATDSAANVTTEIHTLNVVSQLSATNEAPILDQTALDEALPENRTMEVGTFHDMMFAGIFSDPEGGTLYITVSSSDPTVLQLQALNDSNSIRLSAIKSGSAELSIVAKDEGDLTTETVVTIKVVEDTSVSENQAPVLDFDAFASALPPDRSIVLRRFFNMDLTDLFTDPDGDAISISAESSDSSILRVSLRKNGAEAFLLARSLGTADLIITATDSEGNATEARATINVIEESSNRPPEIDRTALTAALPANNTLSEGEFFELQLDSLFSDPDGDEDIVALEGSSTNSDVLDISVDGSNLLTALALSPGNATLSLIARDNAGAETKVDETITVTAASAASLAIRAQSFDRSGPLTLELDEITNDSNTLSAIHSLRLAVGNDSILSASLDGSSLTLRALNKGRTFVKLFNADSHETAIRSMFYVDVVNAAPSLVTPLDNQTTTRVNGLSIDLRGVFEDADGEAFEITARSHDDAIASVALASGTLSIQGLQVGETTVTLTAVDINGAATEVSFIVTIENVAPTLQARVGPIQLQVGGEPYALTFADAFSDDGDSLTYTTTLDVENVVHSLATDSGVTFSPLSKGNVRLNVTAIDPYGGIASFDTEIVVGDDRLKEVATKSLAGFGRAMLGSVSSAIDGRANLDRMDPDFSREERTDQIRSNPPASGFSWIDADAAVLGSSNFGSTSVGAINRTSQTSFSPLQHGFSFNLSDDEDPSPWSVWNNLDRQTFKGDGYQGEQSNRYLGIDKVVGDAWVFGLSVAHHRGESEYVYGTASQRLDIDLTQLLPYVRFNPSDETSMWGTIGVGWGDLRTTVITREDATSDLTSHLAILGARHRIVNMMRVDVSLRGDLASANLTTSVGTSASDGLSTHVHRARAGVEGSYVIDWSNNVAITPFGQVYLRTDSGDGDTASGLEFVGGLKGAYGAISIEAVGRAFEMHGLQPYSERGLSVTATMNPSHDGSGFSASISPSWGSDAYSNGAIWGDFASSMRSVHSITPATGIVNESLTRIDTRLGYGFLLRQERFLLTPFMQFVRSERNSERTQIGMELQQVERASTVLTSRIGIGQSQSIRNQTETTFSASVRLSF